MTRTLRNPLELGGAIHSARRARGWTQHELARRADVSRAFVSDVERGRRPRAEFERVLAVIHAVGLAITLVPDEQPSFDDTLNTLLGTDS